MNPTDPAQSALDGARQAFDRGDQIFQYTETASPDPDAFEAARHQRPFLAVQDCETLNAVCREEWELVNGSFSQWPQDRYVYMIGFYLFRRCEANRRPSQVRARSAVLAPAPAEVAIVIEAPATTGRSTAPATGVSGVDQQPGQRTADCPPSRSAGAAAVLPCAGRQDRSRGWRGLVP